MLIKTLNGIGNHYSPFPVRNSREAEACNDSKIRGTSVDSGLDRRPGDLGGELTSIAWKPLTGPDGVHSSQLMDSYCTAFLVGVFLLLARCQQPYYPFSCHTDSPHSKATFLLDEHSVKMGWPWSCPHTSTCIHSKNAVSWGVSASGLQETEGKETQEQRGGPDGNTNCSQGVVFFNNSAYCKQN